MVAHEADVALPAIGLEVLPLAKKLELPVFDGTELGRQPLCPLVDSARIAPANLRVPCGPSRSVVCVFQCHKEREVVEPWPGTFTETVESHAIRARRIGKEYLCRPKQSRSLEPGRRLEVDLVFWKGRRFGQIRLLKQSLIPQALKAQQQRIAGKSGEALVRRIAVSSGIQGQHLPQLLSGGGKEVRELAGTRPEIADAKATWQRSAVQ